MENSPKNNVLYRDDHFRECFQKIKNGISKKLILQENERFCVVFDESEILTAAKDLLENFPKNSFHCFALKANYLPGIVQIFQKLGINAECASFEEVGFAHDVLKFEYNQIVFDSPCKTKKEIEICLKNEIFLLNVDNFFELGRVKKILRDLFPNKRCKTNIGIRINPQVGKGKIVQFSTATKTSKFGVPVGDKSIWKSFVEEIKDFPEVNCLHCHIGSVMGISKLVEGINFLFNLAEFIERTIPNRIKFLDIGGGKHVSQNHLEKCTSFFEISKNIPQKMKEKYKIITEYGAGLIHRSGYVLSRVEYVKESSDHQIAIIHSGANIFPSVAYSSGSMMILYEKYLHKTGLEIDCEKEKEICKTKKEVKVQLDLGGPLCWSGDLVSFGRKRDYLPSLREDCVIVFTNCGAYTVSEWCKANMRRMPAIYLLGKDGGIKCIKKEESLKKCFSFWTD